MQLNTAFKLRRRGIVLVQFHSQDGAHDAVPAAGVLIQVSLVKGSGRVNRQVALEPSHAQEEGAAGRREARHVKGTLTAGCSRKPVKRAMMAAGANNWPSKP